MRSARSAMRGHAAFGDVPEPALLAAATRSLGSSPNPADLDEVYLRRHDPFRGHGRFRELRRIPGRTRAILQLAQLAYDSILPYRQRCGHWGLLGHALDGSGGAQSRTSGGDAGAGGSGERTFRRGPGDGATHGRAPVDFAHRARVGGMPAGAAHRSAHSLLLEEAQAIAAELGLNSLAAKIERLRATGREPAAPRPRPACPPWITFACRRKEKSGSVNVRSGHSGCATVVACRCWHAWWPSRDRSCTCWTSWVLRRAIRRWIRRQRRGAGRAGAPRLPPPARITARPDRGGGKP